MIKKNPIPNIVYFTLLISLGLSLIYTEYSRYFTYGSIVILIAYIIFDLIRKRREDKISGTQNFDLSIYSMVFIAVLLIAFFFITKQDHI